MFAARDCRLWAGGPGPVLVPTRDVHSGNQLRPARRVEIHVVLRLERAEDV